MSYNVICGDLTKVKADAIIFSANPNPVCGSGLDKAIYEAAGHNELLTERIRIGKIKPGNAKATPAFNLNARYLIHTVAPIWMGGESGEYSVVRSCYENSFDLALELGCKSVATSLIATGINGFEKSVIIKLITSLAEEYTKEHDLDITVVLYEGEDFYDDERLKLVRDHILKSLKGEMTSYEQAYEVEHKRRRIDQAYMNSPYHYSSASSKKSSHPVVDVKDLLASSEETFREKVERYMKEKDLKPSTLYSEAHVSKQTFSKIRLDDDYHPNKYTVICLCLALQLDLLDALDFVESAGWALSKSNKMDLVVRACIINRVYNKDEINKLLQENGLDTLENIK